MESYHVLLAPEPREDNPAHATWGSNVSNAAKDIEAKVIEFLLGEKSQGRKARRYGARREETMKSSSTNKTNCCNQ